MTLLLPAPPRIPVDLTETLALYASLRQSLLAKFDDCALSALFELRYAKGWNTHPQARGQAFHRFAAECLRTLRATGEISIPQQEALEILYEVLLQRDVPLEDRIRVPLREIALLRMAVIKFATDNEFTINRILDIERQLRTVVSYPAADGSTVERELTGTLDVLMSDPRVEGGAGALVIDWKDAQPLDAKILTPSGWTTMGTLAVGDMVVGANGKPTEVIGVHPKGERLVYEVGFTDGSKTRCCDHHFWTVRRSGPNWQVKRLREIIGDELAGNGYWQVPAVQPVAFDTRGELPLDPYLLGVLLGDGDFPVASSVGLTTADDEIVDSVRAALPSGMTIMHMARYNWRLTADSRATRNPLRVALGDLGLMGRKARDKFIPEPHLFATPEERFDLLCGLMDTDGFISGHNQMSFASASVEMAHQVQFVVRSLGGFATIKAWPRDGHSNTNVVYFRLPRAPFRLARKRDRWRTPKKGMTRGIRSITPMGIEAVQCIEVAADDNLYVTDDLILTHNTWALPPEDIEPDDDGYPDKGEHISYEGYFQQRFYGMLVMHNFPAVQQVTLREFYPRKTKVREATVHRATDLEHIEREMAIIAAEFDAAVMAGAAAAGTLKRREAWRPAPGKQCSFCARRSACPIKDRAKGEGIIRDEAMAKTIAGEFEVADNIRSDHRSALMAWTRAHGPIMLRGAKGHRWAGWRERIKHVKRKDGKIVARTESTFGIWTGWPPEAEVADIDRELEQAMRASVTETRRLREVASV